MVQFEITPKAFANLSPGFEEREPWGPVHQRLSNPERVSRLANPSGFEVPLFFHPRVVNPGLKLANAFGVISN
jgi:hypothetical protein